MLNRCLRVAFEPTFSIQDQLIKLSLALEELLLG
jgi:hypothetical protein